MVSYVTVTSDSEARANTSSTVKQKPPKTDKENTKIMQTTLLSTTQSCTEIVPSVFVEMLVQLVCMNSCCVTRSAIARGAAQRLSSINPESGFVGQASTSASEDSIPCDTQIYIPIRNQIN